MGGVDLFDQFVATYRVRIRSKKWWWPFFAWAVDSSMANAWDFVMVSVTVGRKI